MAEDREAALWASVDARAMTAALTGAAFRPHEAEKSPNPARWSTTCFENKNQENVDLKPFF